MHRFEFLVCIKINNFYVKGSAYYEVNEAFLKKRALLTSNKWDDGVL